MPRRKFQLLFAIAVALSLFPIGHDLSFAAPRQREGGYFGGLFGSRPPARAPSYQRQGYANPFLPTPPRISQPNVRKERTVPKQQRRQQQSEPPIAAVEVKPKDPEARKILVIGDILGSELASGLNEQLADERRLAVIDRSVDGSGLMSVDRFDWEKEFPDILNRDKPDFVVIFFGAGDRQMQAGDQRLSVRSAMGERTHARRVDGLIETLKVYGRPYFWMGAPPIRGRAGADEAPFLNSIYKHRVTDAGGRFVDIWDGFTDSSGRFADWGPDKEGKISRLRTGDGLKFTRAGRLKLAFFADRELRREVGDMNLAGPVSNPENQIEVEPGGQKRLVGPVISLSDPRPDASEMLAGAQAATIIPTKQSPQFELMIKGAADRRVPGRVDDFAWPAWQSPSNDLTAAAPATEIGAPVREDEPESLAVSKAD